MNNLKILLTIIVLFFGLCACKDDGDGRTPSEGGYRYEKCMYSKLYTLGCSAKGLGCRYYRDVHVVLPTRTVSKKEYVGYVPKNLYLNKKYKKYIKGKKDINLLANLSLNKKIYLVNMPCVRLEGVGLNCFSSYLTARVLKIDRKYCTRENLSEFNASDPTNLYPRDIAVNVNLDKDAYEAKPPERRHVGLLEMLREFIRSNLKNQHMNMFLEAAYNLGLNTFKLLEKTAMAMRLPVNLDKLRDYKPHLEYPGTTPVLVSKDAPYVLLKDEVDYRPQWVTKV